MKNNEEPKKTNEKNNKKTIGNQRKHKKTNKKQEHPQKNPTKKQEKSLYIISHHIYMYIIRFPIHGFQDLRSVVSECETRG